MNGPQRIVSLLPASTDMLWFLGLGDRVVGVTYECTVPDPSTLPPKVTDTIIPPDASPAEIDKIIGAAMAEGRQLYELDRELLAELDPDLIVTQDLCRVCALPAGDVEAALDVLDCSADVFSYDPMNLTQVLDGITELGRIAGASAAALTKVDRLRERVEASLDVPREHRPKVLFLEWPDPPYGPGHWIPDQIRAAGGEPVLANAGGRSSAMSWDDVAACEAEVLIVGPCGFSEAEAAEQLQTVLQRPEIAGLPAAQTSRVHAIDADRYIVRPGPSLVDGIGVLADLIHGDD
jgi:iron complex transport system substrate-binding protein